MKLTDEKILELKNNARREWNYRADQYNQWDELGRDEQDLEFARAILKEAGVEELERDAERLDFIEQNKTDRPLLFRKGRWSFAKYSNYPVDSHPTLRKAIDAELDR